MPPEGLNTCPLGHVPVWIAPGDVCTLNPTLSMCARMSDDYKGTDHTLQCLTRPELQELWETKHCHDQNGPFVAHDGRLVCELAGNAKLECDNFSNPKFWQCLCPSVLN